MKSITALCTGALLTVSARAWADGYCDHVENVAKAEAALLYTPELFGSFGFGEQPSDNLADTSGRVRFTAGLRYSIGDLVEANATRKRGDAQCERHRALDTVEGTSTYRAVAAKVKVLDGALDEAQKMLDDANADLRARRATAQDVDATRLRVDDLRDLAADAHAELDGLPAPAEGETLKGALAAYYRADAEIEKQEGKLRAARGWDLAFRVGYDQFIGAENDPPFFAVVQFSVDLGWFAEGSYNKKSARARAQVVRDEHPTGELDETAARLQAMLDSEKQRADETAVLVKDLEKQLKTLAKVGGEDSERYRQTVWFDWVKVSAENAYLEAHVAALQEILGQ